MSYRSIHWLQKSVRLGALDIVWNNSLGETEPSAQSFEHPLKETSPLERRVADISGPPHILLLVGEGLRKEGSSASFSGKS